MIYLLFIICSFNADNNHHGYIYKENSEYILKNKHLEIHISGNNEITFLAYHNKSLLTNPATINIKFQNVVVGGFFDDVSQEDHYPQSAELFLQKEYPDVIIKHRYMIDSICFLWKIEILSKKNITQEINVDFSLPIIKCMDHIFYPAEDMPRQTRTIDNVDILYRRDIYCPIITGYNIVDDCGISIVAPFEIHKPALLFSLNKSNLKISYEHLRTSTNIKTEAAIYIIPHGGDWRPGLSFLLSRYPDYFYPKEKNILTGEGWYVTGMPHNDKTFIESAVKQEVKWLEFHNYFPFYGLYMPERNKWDIVINKTDADLNVWEQNKNRSTSGFNTIRSFIELSHRYGIQFYLYMQSFEAWYQYAERYFANDIARDKNGNPLPAWKSNNLMNPDPSGNWGKHIINQTNKLLDRFPDINGIFYDRMDYHDYDFIHDDGITTIDGRPAYMLSFALEKINSRVFDIMHKHKKAVWGNIPTSIEVCKNLDGVMAEVYPRVLFKTQYLGLARPIIFYPYDREPKNTEKKLKLSLLCGAFPSVTLGGIKCHELEEKYHPLFHCLKNREWVLTNTPIRTPGEIENNIFRTPQGDYVAVIISSRKSQLVPDLVEYNVPVTINVDDADKIKYAYLLSGDWMGINAIDFKMQKGTIELNVPYHCTSSLIYLTREKKYDVVRLSSPILIKGERENFVFRCDNANNWGQDLIKVEAPWFTASKKTISSVATFSTIIPDSIEGEVTVKVLYNGKVYKTSCWVLDPISIQPEEEIFITSDEENNVLFHVVNNVNKKISATMDLAFAKGDGETDVHDKLSLLAYEHKELDIPIATKTEGDLILTINTGKLNVYKTFPIRKSLTYEKGDLFFDNFIRGMQQWTLNGGQWHTTNGLVEGSGTRHFAFIQNSAWRDYVFEVKIRTQGSNDPTVDWSDFYIYFRLQDENNFYRFGVHGYGDEVDLQKYVDAKWQKITSTSFTAKINKWYALRIEVRGSNIIGYINGEKVVEANDDTFSSGGIGIGTFYHSMNCEYKDVIVKKL